MAIPFTNREMEKAWRDNMSASCNTPRGNAHRLLLFYAVECGLKATLMRRQRKHRTDWCPVISECQHNVNKLLDCLSANGRLRLPAQLSMESIKLNNLNYDERKFTPGEVNQMWRYGGYSVGTTDQDIENRVSARKSATFYANEVAQMLRPEAYSCDP